MKNGLRLVNNFDLCDYFCDFSLTTWLRGKSLPTLSPILRLPEVIVRLGRGGWAPRFSVFYAGRLTWTPRLLEWASQPVIKKTIMLLKTLELHKCRASIGSAGQLSPEGPDNTLIGFSEDPITFSRQRLEVFHMG